MPYSGLVVSYSIQSRTTSNREIRHESTLTISCPCCCSIPANDTTEELLVLNKVKSDNPTRKFPPPGSTGRRDCLMQIVRSTPIPHTSIHSRNSTRVRANMSVQEYLEKHDLSKRVEAVINACVKAKPDEPLSFMV